MKIYMGPYRSRAISNIHTNYMHWKHGRHEWEDNTNRFEHALEKFEDGLQWVYNHTINLILDKRPGQKIKVRIDNYDTWSMDHTLAPIILPMLKQLKETKHGAPMVDMKDVPKELRATKKQLDAYGKNGEVDPKHFERWDWILDEMIWAFEQKNRDRWEEDYYGPYIESEDKRELFGRFEWIDDEGRQKHQERMSNGFKLFGTYFENLWD